jgi:hypothetical protein
MAPLRGPKRGFRRKKDLPPTFFSLGSFFDRPGFWGKIRLRKAFREPRRLLGCPFLPTYNRNLCAKSGQKNHFFEKTPEALGRRLPPCPRKPRPPFFAPSGQTPKSLYLKFAGEAGHERLIEHLTTQWGKLTMIQDKFQEMNSTANKDMISIIAAKRNVLDQIFGINAVSAEIKELTGELKELSASNKAKDAMINEQANKIDELTAAYKVRAAKMDELTAAYKVRIAKIDELESGTAERKAAFAAFVSGTKPKGSEGQ